jgi:hypothetical protein
MFVITYSNVSGSKWEQLWAEIRWRRRRRRTYVKQFLFDVPYKSKCEMKLAATMDERLLLLHVSFAYMGATGLLFLIFNTLHSFFFEIVYALYFSIYFAWFLSFCFFWIIFFWRNEIPYCVSMKYLLKISKHLLDQYD